MKPLLSKIIFIIIAVTITSCQENKNQTNLVDKIKSDSLKNELLMLQVSSMEKSLDTLVQTVFEQKSVEEQPAQHIDTVKNIDKAEIIKRRLNAIQHSIDNISKVYSFIKSTGNSNNGVWIKRCSFVSCDQPGCAPGGTGCCPQYCCGYRYEYKMIYN